MRFGTGNPGAPDPMPTRRSVLKGAALAMIATLAAPVRADETVTFGLTPVMLESDLRLLASLEQYLHQALHEPVNLVKRRTYQEITAMLLSGQLDAAWVCGFPYVQHQDQLDLLAVPLYHGRPLYQSYVIVNEKSDAQSFDDLRGRIHAFSDPDSNSGFLVTRHLLTLRHTTPTAFFKTFFFTYGHRNVVRAVAAGLAESGSVDGYVWDVVSDREPELASKTRVIRRSELLGFPPVVAFRGARNAGRSERIASALIGMPSDPLGREVLDMLALDGFSRESPRLFDTIGAKWLEVREQA